LPQYVFSDYYFDSATKVFQFDDATLVRRKSDFFNEVVNFLSMAGIVEYLGGNVFKGIRICYFDDFKSLLFQKILESCSHSIHTVAVGNFKFNSVLAPFLRFYLLSRGGGLFNFFILTGW